MTKTEREGAVQIMQRLKQTSHPEIPPALASDGQGEYREAIEETWGKVPEYKGKGRPPTKVQVPEGTMYLQVKKKRAGSRLLGVETQVVYGDPEAVPEVLGAHTAYVERTNLTSRQMNGRLARKTLGFSKELGALRDASAWEDLLYNWTRPVKSLRQPSRLPHRKWDPRSPAMAAGLAEKIWNVGDLLRHVVPPKPINTD